jgi:hypothetical protein
LTIFRDQFGESDEEEQDELKTFSDIVTASKNSDVESSPDSDSVTTNASVALGTSDTEEPPVDINEYETAEQLESLGLEKLKNELLKQGMPCGGTLKERAVRLFSVKGKSEEEIEQLKKGNNNKSKKRKAKKSN